MTLPNAKPLTTAKRPEPGSVISGTMRAEDLGPAFTKVLADYAPELLTNPEDPGVSLAGVDWTGDDVGDLMEHLWDALDAIAPPGCYFGSHPGDGTDFGFWPIADLPGAEPPVAETNG